MARRGLDYEEAQPIFVQLGLSSKDNAMERSVD